MNNYTIVRKEVIDKSLSNEPVQGCRKLEPLQSLVSEKQLPFFILEDKEVVNEAEIHQQIGDLFECLEGEVNFIFGGKLVEHWMLNNPDGSVNENELRSKTIEGGEKTTLKPGDALWIPAGCAHQHSCPGVARLLIVKIPVSK